MPGIVDDSTHEAVTIHPEHALGAGHLIPILSHICHGRGYPQIIRTDNGKEFTSKAMLNCAHDHGVTLRLIEPGTESERLHRSVA